MQSSLCSRGCISGPSSSGRDAHNRLTPGRLTSVIQYSRRRTLRLPPAMVFTGLVQGMAEVIDVDTKDRFCTVKIKFPPACVEGIKIGGSVAINGMRLTVTAADKDQLAFDIMTETLRATNLGELGAGSVVNFERAGDDIGGHHVSGHIHTTATIANIDITPNNRRVDFVFSDQKWMKYIFYKGYVAVDGTSLTIGEVSDCGFSVYLIPETLRSTVFGIKSVGDTVNIEIETQTQVTVDTVERMLEQYMAKVGLQQAPSAAAAAAAAAAQAAHETAAAAAAAAQRFAEAAANGGALGAFDGANSDFRQLSS